MVHFYWIFDHEITPESPSSERHLGSVDMDEFRSLSKLWKRCDDLGTPVLFSRDCRLNHDAVQQLLDYAHHLHQEANTPFTLGGTKPVMTLYVPIIRILQRASHAGLVTFSD